MLATMSQAEYAAHRGVGKPAVTGWKKSGLLVMVTEDGKQRIDVAATDARLHARVDTSRGRPATGTSRAAPEPSGVVRPLNEVRSELVEEQIFASRIANAELVKQLVPMAEAVRRVSELARMARERAHAELRAVNDRLALEPDPHDVAGIWGKALDKAFTTLANAIEPGALVSDDSEDEEEPEPEDE